MEERLSNCTDVGKGPVSGDALACKEVRKRKMVSLRKGREFSDVYHFGASKANKLLVMIVRNNELSYNRIGISVSRKVGNSVVRHRIKRLISESLRVNGDRFNIGLDIVVIARGTAKDRPYREIHDAVMHLAHLSKIVP